MSWFKKLSIEKHENQNKKKYISKKNLPKIVKKKLIYNNNYYYKKLTTTTTLTKKGLSLSWPQIHNEQIINDSCGNYEKSVSIKKFEILDPEDFFEDPEHVRNYKEEAKFINILSDWEIIENPLNIGDNYFSADFEDEFVATRSRLDLTCDLDKLTKLSLENLLELNTDSNSSYLFRFLFGYNIKNGLLCKRNNNINENDNMKLKKELRQAIVMKRRKNYTKSTENFIKENSKTEALSRSIMGSIGKCPGKDLEKKPGQSRKMKKNDNNDDDEYIIDHFDIQQYFRLDDYGNILLNFDHIEEEKGYGFLMRRTKRFYRNITKGRAIDENFMIRKSLINYLKKIFKCFGKLLTGHPRNKPLILGGPGDTVRSYTLQLAKDQTSTFARNIENFISCTKDSREAAPQVVMRNMRQFMNGMKNYLVKHGEADFHSEVEKARSRLKSDEFLNLDSLLETVMHQLVVLPLREHLYGMFVDYYTRSSDIQLLAENVKYACARNPTEFGIRSTVNPPSSIALQQISILLLRLQEAELPLEKLDLFLCIISAIFDSTGCSRGQQLGADDFLPILVYVVAKCGFVGAEIEAEFMWGLLQPALLNGEAGYYLTALCSAVHVLKCFMASDNDGNGSLDWRSSSMPACSSVLRVIIPDEFNGSLQTRTLPVRPHTTTREVCRIIAHKARITNPQDYGLFKLVDGEETILTDIECPQDARLAARGKHCMLAYKRIDAKIAWPTATSS